MKAVTPGGRGFSLIRGGPSYRLVRRLGLPRGLRGHALLAVGLSAFCLLPLVLLSAMAGTLLPGAGAMALFGDYATLGRLLVALPALVLIAPDCDRLARRALAHIVRSGLLRPVDRPAVAIAAADIGRLRNATWPEALLLLLAFLPSLLPDRDDAALKTIAGWHHDAAGGPTVPGLWLEYVAKPLYLFVALLWVWRLVLWSLMLWRLSRLELNLSAAHPDGAGGLGFLAATQQSFARFSFAGGVIIAGAVANEISYRGATLDGTLWMLATYVVVTTAIVCAPLLLFVPRLVGLKRRGLLAYGALGTSYVRAFERKWLPSRPAAPVRPVADGPRALDELGGDYAALTDLNTAYLVAGNLSIVPVTRKVLLAAAIPAILPMLPVALLALGVQDAVKKLLGILV